MPFCENCGEHYFASVVNPDLFKHVCPPFWRVVCPEYDGTTDPSEGRRIRARSAEQAVEAWAEWFDSSDWSYTIAKGDEVEVYAQRDGFKAVHVLTVRGESEPVYHASETAVHENGLPDVES